MIALEITIPVAPITKKNSQKIVTVRGRALIVPSDKYRAYERAARPFCPPSMIDVPVNVRAIYYVPTRRRVDITNLESALLDVLVAAGTLEDDNCSIVVSTDGSRVRYDKNNPRTEVLITTAEDYEPEFRRGE